MDTERHRASARQAIGAVRRIESRALLAIVLGGLAATVAVATLVLGLGAPPRTPLIHLTYPALVAQVDAGNVATAIVDDATQDISGTLRHPVTVGFQSSTAFAVSVYPFDGAAARRLLTSHGVRLLSPAPLSLRTRLADLGIFLLGLAGLALLWCGLRRVSLSTRPAAADAPRA